jgi:4-nitrophenyl phosphatase
MLVDELGYIRSLILDMDGVLWRASEPIGDLKRIFEKIRQLNLSTILATNNSTKTPEEYQEKLLGFGVTVESWQILTSSQVAADFLSRKFPGGGSVYIVGENGLKIALQEKGFFPQENGSVLAVVAGMDRSITYDKLAKASSFIRNGAIFIGTNSDKTFPTPLGLAPGAGSILSFLETASGVPAQLMGKPLPAMFELALARSRITPEQTLVVGDRLETDILGGQNAHCRTALVLSGVTTIELSTSSVIKADQTFLDLNELIIEIGST